MTISRKRREWALGLLLICAAGLYSSTQAQAQIVDAGGVEICRTEMISLTLNTEYHPDVDEFAVSSVTVQAPKQCIGVQMNLTLLGGNANAGELGLETVGIKETTLSEENKTLTLDTPVTAEKYQGYRIHLQP